MHIISKTKQKKQTDEAFSWGYDGQIPSGKTIRFGFLFVGPSMHPSVIIAQHKDLKMHPHANGGEKKKEQ